MKSFNRWRFFAGIIFLFAGLDVTLLLSHLSRLVGIVLFFIGLSLIVFSHPRWSKNVLGKIPSPIKKHFSLRNIKIYQYFFLVLLSVLSVFLFYSQLLIAIFVISLIIGSWLVLRITDTVDDKSLILVSMEFQTFLVISTFIFLNFGKLFGYRDPPEIIPLIFIFLAWLIEVAYLRGKLTSKHKLSTKSQQKIEDEDKPYLSERIILLSTLNGNLKKYLPLAGALVFLAVITFNLYTGGTELNFGSHDAVTFLMGVALLAYNYIPEKYSLERDFTLLFLIFLFFILVLPITIIHYYYGPMTEATTSPVVYHLLARPTAGLLSIIGISSSALVEGDWVLIEVMMPSIQNPDHYIRTKVGIGLSCTGLYSVSIFISAFLSFIMVHFRKLDLKLFSFMALGIFASWVANVLRMTIIMVMGHLYGNEAMSWTHNNAGIFIFMAWIALFWGVMFWYFDIPIRDIGGE